LSDGAGERLELPCGCGTPTTTEPSVECQHFHAVNYANEDPATAYPDGALRCLDCGQMFTPPERPVTVESALKELREMFPDAKFITLSGDYTNRWSGENLFSTRIQVGGSWKDGGSKYFVNAPTLSEATAQVRAAIRERANDGYRHEPGEQYTPMLRDIRALLGELNIAEEFWQSAEKELDEIHDCDKCDLCEDHHA
jgi:hypothetical protein